MANEHVLVVDDEEDILELMRYVLTKHGYQVSMVSSGEDALAKMRVVKPDLLLLDLMLPGIDGLDVCKIAKNDRQLAEIPIIMITAKGEEADVVSGLELGADDYITKPFSPRVLLARIRAVLRKGTLKPHDLNGSIKIGEIVIDTERHTVIIAGSPVEMTHTEFRVLHFLASRPGRVYTRYQIIDGIRGEEYIVTDRSVDVQIAGLRKKMDKCANYIETVRGVGYRMKDFYA